MKEYNLDWVSKLSGIKNYLNNNEFILLMFTGSSWYQKSVMQSSKSVTPHGTRSYPEQRIQW
jgi:hypothetical protein